MASGPFTLVQLADAVGMSLADVRFYRDCGLLQPPRRQRGRTDDVRFDAAHVQRLRFIQRALAYGFAHDDIARLMDEAGLGTCNDVYRLSVQRLEELRRDRGTDDATARALEELIATCAGVGPRSDCGILAVLSSRGAARRRVRPWRRRST